MGRVLWPVSAIAAAAFSFAAASAQAATVLDVSWNSGCGKSTCFNEQGVFKQSWSSKDAAGPMTVGKLLLDRGVLGSLDGETFRLSFQVDGKEIGTWGSFTMGGIGGDELQFNGEAFTWNPEDGELTLVLEIFKPKPGMGGGPAFSAPAGRTGSNAETPPQGDPPPNDGGVVFDAIPGAAVVPEPATWALMIGGFGLAGAMLRRNTRVVA
jgi:hypothetical protein